MKRAIIAILATTAITGCQNSATVKDPGVGAYIGLVGAQLRLVEPLHVASGRARVFIQDGTVPGGRNPLLQGSFDQYKTHCAVEIDSVDHQGVTIQPDTFQILRVQHSLERVVQSGHLMMANRAVAFGLDWGGSSSYHEGYHFYLYSERQPSVMRMSCYGVYAQPYELSPPTLPEIRTALGGLAEINR